MRSDSPSGDDSPRDSPSGDDTPQDTLAAIPTECYDMLRNPRRLRLLEILGRCDRRLTLEELTTELASESYEIATTRKEIRISLVHNHLPRLAEHEIVDWDPDIGVELDDSFPIDPATIAGLLDTTGQNVETTLRTVVHPVRLPLCRVLANRGPHCSLDVLAAELAARDVVTDTDRAAIELHHSHLPALATAGVVAYDSNTQLVTVPEQSLPTMG